MILRLYHFSQSVTHLHFLHNPSSCIALSNSFWAGKLDAFLGNYSLPQLLDQLSDLPTISLMFLQVRP